MTYNLARVVGPTLAAVSIVAFGIPVTFAVNATLPAVLLLALLVVHPAARRRVRRGEARLRESPARDAAGVVLALPVLVIAGAILLVERRRSGALAGA